MPDAFELIRGLANVIFEPEQRGRHSGWHATVDVSKADVGTLSRELL
jgi:hypothetical protein